MRFNRLAAALCIAAMLAQGGCKSSESTRADGSKPRKLSSSEKQQQKLTDAEAAMDSGDYNVALSLFQEILATNPTVTTAYLGIGDIYMIRRDYDKAEPAYSRAAKLEPRNFDAQYGHGLALQMLERFVDAVKAFHRALTIDPENFKANLALATTYLQMNEARNAITFAEKAVELDPGNGSARVNLGAAYEKVGRDRDAIDQYLAARELVEDTPPLMLNLINVLAREKRYQEAANTAENLVKVSPSANAYERLGWCYFRLSDFNKSMAAYKEAVEIDPKHWQSWLNLGIVSLFDKHDVKTAEEAFAKVQELNPAFQGLPQIQQELQKIKAGGK